MEVHPPEHPIQTWRQFFIHIATIVVGLLIAIGLEQGVEALHRRHLLHEAEAKLADEFRENRETLHRDREQIQGLRDEMKSDLALLKAQEAHAGGQDRLRLAWDWSNMTETALDTARDSGALVLMPYDAAERHNDLYRQAQLVNTQAGVVFRDLVQCTAPLEGTRSLTGAKPAEIDSMITAARQTLVDLQYLDMLAANLDRMYRENESHS